MGYFFGSFIPRVLVYKYYFSAMLGVETRGLRYLQGKFSQQNSVAKLLLGFIMEYEV